MAKAKTAGRAPATPAAEKPKERANALTTQVRKRIKQLVEPGPPTQGEDPYWVLRNALVGSGTWSDASAPAVTLLLQSVPGAADPTPLLLLAADILGGDQLRGWLSRPDTPMEAHQSAAHDAAVEKKAVLLSGLSSNTGVVRGAAAMLLAMVPGLAAESVPALVTAAAEDAHEIARAGGLLALGRLGIGSAAAGRVIDSSRVVNAPPLVRGAAGMAWLRQDGNRPFDEAKDEIAQWLGYVPPEGVELPWLEAPHWFRTLSFPDAPGRALLGLGRSRGDAGTQALVSTVIALAGTDDGVVEAQLAKIMVDVGGFSSRGGCDPDHAASLDSL